MAAKLKRISAKPTPPAVAPTAPAPRRAIQDLTLPEAQIAFAQAYRQHANLTAALQQISARIDQLEAGK